MIQKNLRQSLCCNSFWKIWLCFWQDTFFPNLKDWKKFSKWERVLNRKYQTQVQFINFWKQIWWAKSFIWQEVKVNFFTCKCVCQICRQISYCDERLNCCCTHKLFVALTLQNRNLFCHEQFFWVLTDR